MPAKKKVDTEQDVIVNVKLSELHPFKNHPFKVLDDELMQQTIPRPFHRLSVLKN